MRCGVIEITTRPEIRKLSGNVFPDGGEASVFCPENPSGYYVYTRKTGFPDNRTRDKSGRKLSTGYAQANPDLNFRTKRGDCDVQGNV